MSIEEVNSGDFVGFYGELSANLEESSPSDLDWTELDQRIKQVRDRYFQEKSMYCEFRRSFQGGIDERCKAVPSNIRLFKVEPSFRWNHDCFPIPTNHRIAQPVPDAETCLKFGESLKNDLLNWMEKEDFVGLSLISKNDFKLIEGIVRKLFDDLSNQALLAGLYRIEPNWKDLLEPISRLRQFWMNKWKMYHVPPSPYDYPLPSNRES